MLKDSGGKCTGVTEDEPGKTRRSDEKRYIGIEERRTRKHAEIFMGPTETGDRKYV